jgi:hypothetical protein
MSGPVHLNQVIFQTPNVEKIHETDRQNPEMTHRHIIHEDQAQLRQRTETVQQSVQPEESRILDERGKEKHERRKKNKKHQTESEDAARKASASAAEFQGGIVDVVV